MKATSFPNRRYIKRRRKTAAVEPERFHGQVNRRMDMKKKRRTGKFHPSKVNREPAIHLLLHGWQEKREEDEQPWEREMAGG